MTDPLISRGFRGRRHRDATARRLPAGQHATRDFPVLSAGPTPHTSLAIWDFTVHGRGGPEARWTWEEFQALPHEAITADIHCVTQWSKLDTVWEGVSVDTLFKEALARGVELAPHVLAVSDGVYTTNLPLADVTGGKAWVAVRYAGAPLPPEHGGPARLLVPHLYFWKSAKWVRLLDRDERGFWESLGYHNYGDPWREQRYDGDCGAADRRAAPRLAAGRGGRAGCGDASGDHAHSRRPGLARPPSGSTRRCPAYCG